MVYTKGIKGFNHSVCIGGFRSDVIGDVDYLLKRVEAAVSPHVFQLFDADRVAGWQHIYFAAINALKAFESGIAISRSLYMEILLYASCQNQISQAFTILGLTPTSERVALIVMADLEIALRAFNHASRILGTKDDFVLQINAEKLRKIKKIFSITDLELRTMDRREIPLTRLLIERGAILPIQR